VTARAGQPQGCLTATMLRASLLEGSPDMAPAGGAAVHASFCSRTAQASGAAWGRKSQPLRSSTRVRYTTTTRTSSAKNAAGSGDHLGAATAGCGADGPEPSPGEPRVNAPRSGHRGHPTTLANPAPSSLCGPGARGCRPTNASSGGGKGRPRSRDPGVSEALVALRDCGLGMGGIDARPPARRAPVHPFAMHVWMRWYRSLVSGCGLDLCDAIEVVERHADLGAALGPNDDHVGEPCSFPTPPTSVQLVNPWLS
jgi:hypothetical protein